MGRDDAMRTPLGPLVDQAFTSLLTMNAALLAESHYILSVLRTLAQQAYDAPHPAADAPSFDGDVEQAFTRARSGAHSLTETR